MDLLDENIQQLLARSGSYPIRIASKSVRCRQILEYILKADSQFQGIMSFSGEEAIYLSEYGFDDILVAYPEVNHKSIHGICSQLKKGSYINLIIDKPEHAQLLNKIGAQNKVVIPVSIDIDLSVDFPVLHFGVWRSSIRKPNHLQSLLDEISGLEHIRLEGVMGYEAQIAGVTDKVRGKRMMNNVIRSLKRNSIQKIAAKRKKAVEMINERGFELKIVNGGGTGSLETTIQEQEVTEVTVGSGFFNSHLFDNYQNFKHLPAAGFACAINRKPDEGIYTCHGGGYIASGSTEELKQPLPYLPEGTKLTSNEGAGEVQTPVLYKGAEKLEIGDPIFFRHSKAGELCERFNELHLIKNNKIQMAVPTYRGEGQCFL